MPRDFHNLRDTGISHLWTRPQQISCNVGGCLPTRNPATSRLQNVHGILFAGEFHVNDQGGASHPWHLRSVEPTKPTQGFFWKSREKNMGAKKKTYYFYIYMCVYNMYIYIYICVSLSLSIYFFYMHMCVDNIYIYIYMRACKYMCIYIYSFWV